MWVTGIMNSRSMCSPKQVLTRCMTLCIMRVNKTKEKPKQKAPSVFPHSPPTLSIHQLSLRNFSHVQLLDGSLEHLQTLHSVSPLKQWVRQGAMNSLGASSSIAKYFVGLAMVIFISQYTHRISNCTGSVDTCMWQEIGKKGKQAES